MLDGFAVLIPRRGGPAVVVDMHVWRIAQGFEHGDTHYEHVASTATKSAALSHVARINAARKPRTVTFASAAVRDAFRR